MWWMPWRLQAMKDVEAYEKLRGAGKQALIRRCPNGETWLLFNWLLKFKFRELIKQESTLAEYIG